MASLTDLYKKRQPFCVPCCRFLTPAQARAHSVHATAIVWPKPRKTKTGPRR